MTKKQRRRRVEPDRHRTEAAPVDLRAFSRGKLEHQEGGFAHGPDLAHELFEDAVAAGVALLPELLEDLLGGVGMALEEGLDLSFEGIELARPALVLDGAGKWRGRSSWRRSWDRAPVAAAIWEIFKPCSSWSWRSRQNVS